MKIHKSIRKYLNYGSKVSDDEILKDWKKRTFELCKPCWELRYCPYGPVVEDFPLFPPTRDEAIEHNNYFKECLKTGKLGSGEKLDIIRKRWFKKEVANFNSNGYPKIVPRILLEASCRVFGHVCPVFIVAEPLTETKKKKKS